MAESELTLVRDFDLQHEMDCAGMTTLSPDSVALGISSNGAYAYSASGECTQHLTNNVADLARLSDGRAAVSIGVENIAVYNPDSSLSRHFMGLKNYSRLCSLDADANDNIYVVNGGEGISHFQLKTWRPYRVIPTGDLYPTQVCVTNVGTMIASNAKSIAVYGTDGARGSTIQSNGEEERMYAPVYSSAENLKDFGPRPDTVIVARLRNGSNALRLVTYALEGTTLTETKTSKELDLPEKVDLSAKYASTACLACLRPDLVALACGKKLYFIQM